MQKAKDAQTNFEEMKARILAFAKERDWEKFHTPKNLSMALAAEAGELMEHFLWEDGEASKAKDWSATRRAKVEEELSDIVIYAFEFANIAGIDLAASMERKIEINAAKYPVEKARGKATKYTEL